MNEPENKDRIQMVHPQYLQASYQEDEISLIDTWIELVNYKKQFLWVFISIAILGLPYALFMFDERYALNSAIEIGTALNNGSVVALEAPESVKSKLSTVLVPRISQEFLKAYPELDEFDTSISSAKGSEVVLIGNQVKEKRLALFKQYQTLLAEALINDHDQKIAFYQADFKSQLAFAQDALEQLLDPVNLELKLKRERVRQVALQSKIEAIEEGYRLMKEGGTEALISSLSDDERSTLTKDGEIDPVMANVRLQQALLENRTNAADSVGQLESISVSIENIKQNHQIEIEKQQREVEKVQAKLDTFNRTRVISEPVRSLKPNGLTRKLLIVLVVVLAMFGGFAAMLFALFSDKVRQRREELA